MIKDYIYSGIIVAILKSFMHQLAFSASPNSIQEKYSNLFVMHLHSAETNYRAIVFQIQQYLPMMDCQYSQVPFWELVSVTSCQTQQSFLETCHATKMKSKVIFKVKF